jgi:hypothetical protein
MFSSPITKEDIESFLDFFLIEEHDELQKLLKAKTFLSDKKLQKGVLEKSAKLKVPTSDEAVSFSGVDIDYEKMFEEWECESEPFRKPAAKEAEDRLVYRIRSDSNESSKSRRAVRKQLRNDVRLVGANISAILHE